VPTLSTTRLLGAVAALAGLVGFTCQFAVPIDVGGETITLSEDAATFRDVGIGGHLLLLAALGLVAAIRPAVGARVLALGGLGLPLIAGSIDQLWADDAPGAMRVLAGAIGVGVLVGAVAVVLGTREVTWSAGGVLLGDGLATLVAGAVLWGLLGINWYRVRDLGADALLDPRFGALLDTSTGGGRATWVAAAVAVVAVGVAVAGGGWGRKMAGAVVAVVCGFEVLRRVFLSGERLIPPADQANPFGVALSGEPVLGLLVLPLIGLGAAAWLLTTEGEPQRLAARNPSDSAEAGSA
jgi:hypothetical protein